MSFVPKTTSYTPMPGKNRYTLYLTTGQQVFLDSDSKDAYELAKRLCPGDWYPGWTPFGDVVFSGAAVAAVQKV